MEKVAGLPFADYQRTCVLDPLGMTGSSFVRDQRVEANSAASYMLVADGRAIERLGALPAGNLYTSAEGDLVLDGWWKDNASLELTRDEQGNVTGFECDGQSGIRLPLLLRDTERPHVLLFRVAARLPQLAAAYRAR